MFLERKIAGRMQGGERFRSFQSLSGWHTLLETINVVIGKDHAYTKLVPELKGVDPDDAFSSVPYEKGSALLLTLEQKLGGSGARNSFSLFDSSFKFCQFFQTFLRVF